jgi:hypothetical protein
MQVIDQAIQRLYARIRTLNNMLLRVRKSPNISCNCKICLQTQRVHMLTLPSMFLAQCHHVILERRAQTTTRKDPREIINEAGSELNLLWTMMDAIFRSVSCVMLLV